MNLVYVVDRDAKDLAAEYNGIAKREGHSVKYVAAQTPERLFEEMDDAIPSLILLHHTWPGYSVAALLARIRKKTTDIRVVVFTGREPDVPELIECIRLGVCDYWLKSGTVDPIVWARKIVTYCDSDVLTLEVLSKPSGTVINLLTTAESNLTSVKTLQAQVEDLEQRLSAATSTTNRDVVLMVVRVVESVLYLMVLAVVFVVVSRYTSPKAAAGLVVLFAVFFLFLQGRVAKAFIDWKQGRATLEGSKR